ncbi:hypothetical protein H4W33_005099 [Kibdelosporangium phytohabitans]|nr:hypothetical protein [Kibdelosporangium phytohabitans]
MTAVPTSSHAQASRMQASGAQAQSGASGVLLPVWPGRSQPRLVRRSAYAPGGPGESQTDLSTTRGSLWAGRTGRSARALEPRKISSMGRKNTGKGSCSVVCPPARHLSPGKPRQGQAPRPEDQPLGKPRVAQALAGEKRVLAGRQTTERERGGAGSGLGRGLVVGVSGRGRFPSAWPAGGNHTRQGDLLGSQPGRVEQADPLTRVVGLRPGHTEGNQPRRRPLRVLSQRRPDGVGMWRG